MTLIRVMMTQMTGRMMRLIIVIIAATMCLALTLLGIGLRSLYLYVLLDTPNYKQAAMKEGTRAHRGAGTG